VPNITKPNVENVAVIPLTEIKRLRRPVFPV
jgi:hypothetical protein